MKINLETEKPLYPDLVNNYGLFRAEYTQEELAKFNYNDNTDYSHYEHIDDFVQRDFTDDQLAKSYIVQVPINYIFSSESTRGGYDRTIWATENKVQNISNLNTPNDDGDPKGYNETDAGILSGVLRPAEVVDAGSRKTLWQLVKFTGNNRVVKKLFANNGKVTNVLMSITIHKERLTQKEYIKIEAERHTTDAGDRSGQNEKQKFSSGLRAGRKAYVECFNFLKNNCLNYYGIMQQENVTGADKFLKLESLSGLKEGVGNGFFKKFGESNVVAAIETIRDIAKITGETSIGMSPIECLSSIFQSFTEYGKTENAQQMMFSKGELKEFFVAYFKHMNNSNDMFSGDGNKCNLLLKHLNASSTIKCMVYIGASKFWPALPNYWKKMRKNDISFSDGCYAVKHYTGKCKDPMLKRDIIAKVT